MRLPILNRWKLYIKKLTHKVRELIGHRAIGKIAFKCLSSLYKPIEKARIF